MATMSELTGFWATEEVADPSFVAEGWDSWDLPEDTAAGTPGWHVGPSIWNDQGYFLLNNSRHPNGPNILYADGHVASDATTPIGDFVPGWSSLRAVTWSDYHEKFGTLRHMMPKAEILGQPSN